MFTDTGNGNFSFKEKIVAGSGAGSFEMSGSGKVSGSTLSFNGSWTNSGCSGTTQGNLTLSTASSGTSSPSSSGTSSGTNSPSSSGTSSGTNSPSSNTSSAKPTKLADLAGTWKVQGQSATFTVSSSGDTSAFDYVSKVSGWCFLGEPFSATIPATPGAVDSSNFGMKLFYSKGENSYGNNYWEVTISGTFTTSSTFQGTYEAVNAAVGFCRDSGNGAFVATKQ
ncbi:MAG: hypothetical protein HQL62_08160 [Magnetococcales bacterium]|nr:hypothetical protein [Magnetococcales bacterium]